MCRCGHGLFQLQLRRALKAGGTEHVHRGTLQDVQTCTECVVTSVALPFTVASRASRKPRPALWCPFEKIHFEAARERALGGIASLGCSNMEPSSWPARPRVHHSLRLVVYAVTKTSCRLLLLRASQILPLIILVSQEKLSKRGATSTRSTNWSISSTSQGRKRSRGTTPSPRSAAAHSSRSSSALGSRQGS